MDILKYSVIEIQVLIFGNLCRAQPRLSEEDSIFKCYVSDSVFLLHSYQHVYKTKQAQQQTLDFTSRKSLRFFFGVISTRLI